MKPQIISISFFWKNDKPGGLGFTLSAPGFTPEFLTDFFSGESDTLKQYYIDSDHAMGTRLVQGYLTQLEFFGKDQESMGLPEIITAALNIMWLSSRGFIPQDEFNGYQIVWKHN